MELICDTKSCVRFKDNVCVQIDGVSLGISLFVNAYTGISNRWASEDLEITEQFYLFILVFCIYVKNSVLYCESILGSVF